MSKGIWMMERELALHSLKPQYQDNNRGRGGGEKKRRRRRRTKEEWKWGRGPIDETHCTRKQLCKLIAVIDNRLLQTDLTLTHRWHHRGRNTDTITSCMKKLSRQPTQPAARVSVLQRKIKVYFLECVNASAVESVHSVQHVVMSSTGWFLGRCVSPTRLTGMWKIRLLVPLFQCFRLNL